MKNKYSTCNNQTGAVTERSLLRSDLFGIAMELKGQRQKQPLEYITRRVKGVLHKITQKMFLHF